MNPHRVRKAETDCSRDDGLSDGERAHKPWGQLPRLPGVGGHVWTAKPSDQEYSMVQGSDGGWHFSGTGWTNAGEQYGPATSCADSAG